MLGKKTRSLPLGASSDTPLESIVLETQKQTIQLRAEISMVQLHLRALTGKCFESTGTLSAVNQSLSRAHQSLYVLTSLQENVLLGAQIQEKGIAVKMINFISLFHDILYEEEKRTSIRVMALPTECFVIADAEKIRYVLHEYITNAMRFSSQTQPIEVTVRLFHSGVYCVVRDYGIGVSKEDTSRIFDKYYKVKEDGPGFGLGLYNARLIIEKHKGSIGVETAEGIGSMFYFTLQTVAVHV